MLLAKDIMTRDVITIHYSASIRDLSKLLSERGITGVPVTDENNRLLGMISMRDVIREEVRRLGASFDYQDIHELFSAALATEESEAPGPQLWVEEIMSRNLYTATETTPVCEICRLTHFRQFEKLSYFVSRTYRDRKSSRHYIFSGSL
ncbi:MAG: CBS domain-containing protein, partial [Candidatus Abyssobacteria bacterium SURF_5]